VHVLRWLDIYLTLDLMLELKGVEVGSDWIALDALTATVIKVTQ